MKENELLLASHELVVGTGFSRSPTAPSGRWCSPVRCPWLWVRGFTGARPQWACSTNQHRAASRHSLFRTAALPQSHRRAMLHHYRSSAQSNTGHRPDLDGYAASCCILRAISWLEHRCHYHRIINRDGQRRPPRTKGHG